MRRNYLKVSSLLIFCCLFKSTVISGINVVLLKKQENNEISSKRSLSNEIEQPDPFVSRSPKSHRVHILECSSAAHPNQIPGRSVLMGVMWGVMQDFMLTVIWDFMWGVIRDAVWGVISIPILNIHFKFQC
jgi:hypothetical protein